MFTLLIMVFGGWAALDAFQWSDLTNDQRYLTVGFGLFVLLALVILGFVDHPLRRDLRLARTGEVAQGQVVAINRRRRRRKAFTLAYTFRTSAGDAIAGECALPRRYPAETLEPGMALEVLYDPKNPAIHKPRLVLMHIEFGPARRTSS